MTRKVEGLCIVCSRSRHLENTTMYSAWCIYYSGRKTEVKWRRETNKKKVTSYQCLVLRLEYNDIILKFRNNFFKYLSPFASNILNPVPVECRCAKTYKVHIIIPFLWFGFRFEIHFQQVSVSYHFISHPEWIDVFSSIIGSCNKDWEWKLDLGHVNISSTLRMADIVSA